MSDYCLEDCSLYKIEQIQSKPIIAFDDHNMALPVWGQWSSRLGQPGTLLTLDTHTDTRCPFCAYFSQNSYDTEMSLDHPVIKKILKDRHYKRDDFDFEDVYKLACGYVKNDEHIQTAYRFGYISSYNVVCRVNTNDLKEYERRDYLSGFDAHYYSNPEQIKNLKINNHLFLDFDLDFFVDRRVINDKFKQIISPFVKNAYGITIAREPNFVKTCCAGYEADDIYSNLISTIRDILK